MPQIIPCPHCGTNLNIPDEVLGKHVQCTAAGCGKAFLAQANPSPVPAAPVTAAPPAQVRSGPAPQPPLYPAEHQERSDGDDYDDDDDYEERRYIRRDEPPVPGTGVQIGTGVASLVIGIIAVLIAFIPCVGFLGLIPAGIGLILGVIGIIVGLVQERRGMGFPIAGLIVNCLSVVVVVAWWVVFIAFAATSANRAAEQVKMQQERLMNGDERVLNKLERIAKAMHEYHNTHGKFPAAKDKDGNLSWRVHLLPFLGEAALFKKFRLNERWDSVHNFKLLEKMPDVYKPEKRPFGGPEGPQDETFYMVFIGPDGPFAKSGELTIPAISDGTKKTIMIAEADFTVPWSRPADIPFNRKGFAPPKLGQRFNTGFHVVNFAAEAYYIRMEPDDQTLRAWITHNGGELVRVIGDN